MRTRSLVALLLFSLAPLAARAQTHDASGAADVSTPRRALATFLADAREGRWVDAAHVLDLREVPTARREELGAAAAHDLVAVLRRHAIRPDALPDETDPHGETAIELTRVAGDSVTLHRVRRDGTVSWLFSPTTVRNARELAAHADRGPIGDLAPDVLVAYELGGLEAWQWIALAVAVVLAVLAATALGKAITAIAHRIAPRDDRMALPRLLLDETKGPMRAAIFLVVLGLLATLVRLGPEAMPVAGRFYTVLWVLDAAWLFLRVVDVGARQVADQAAEKEGWRARGTRTRVMILRRVLRVTGIVVLSAILLMQIDAVRQLGVSLLASAGVAGIVVGLAAQRTIGNLLAGIQLSFTQPLRVGDEVVVEGEFGTVEEINLSYVVVKIWDERRLIVPMTRLLESPFQNWTRVSSQLIGEVKVPIDFGTPIGRIREDVTAYVKAHSLFDGRTVAVQVTDAKERTAELRVLVSAASSSALYDLRCATREHLLEFLRTLDEGRYLPRVRVNPLSVGSTHQSAAGVES